MELDNLYIPLSRERVDKVIALAKNMAEHNKYNYTIAVRRALKTLGHNSNDAYVQVMQASRYRSAATRVKAAKLAKDAKEPPREAQGGLF